MPTITHPTLTDIYGRPVTINAEPGYHGFGTRPYTICKEVRDGVLRYVATWLPTNNSARFVGKRDATAFIQAHEEIAYGTGP
jgi:hypothetical protein